MKKTSKNVYIVKKYVQAESIKQAIELEKTILPTDVYLTEYSAQQHLEELQPRNQTVGFNNSKEDESRP